MGFSFFPKTPKFFDLFMKQSAKLIESVSILTELFHDFTDVEERCNRIHVIEDDANLIYYEVFRQLSKTFITPIDREDIHQINLAQKDVHNLINAVSTRIAICGFTRINNTAKEVVDNLNAMIVEAGRMLEKLGSRKEMDGNYKTVKQLKEDSETLLLLALEEIYGYNVNRPEVILDILDIIKWSQIYDRIEQAINRTEGLADIIQGIILKNA